MQVSALASRLRVLPLPRVLLALSISTAFFLALLLPRAAASRFLPLPFVDRARLAEIDRVELSRFAFTGDAQAGSGAHSAQDGPVSELSVGVRTVGELFRRAGALLAAGSPEVGGTLGELRSQFRAEVERGKTKELLALRSLQGQLFVRALLEGVGAEQRSRELEELGGEFAHLAGKGWLGLGGSPTSGPSVDAATLRLLFRVRWGLLVGCHREVPFGPSIDELRGYYSVYLLHPPLAGADEAALAFERARYATALGEIDSDFPVELAMGALLLQAGQLELAIPHLRAHRGRSGDGPFANLARNYFLFAVSGP